MIFPMLIAQTHFPFQVFSRSEEFSIPSQNFLFAKKIFSDLHKQRMRRSILDQQRLTKLDVYPSLLKAQTRGSDGPFINP
jgi:hypothetical protein